jgi:acid-sensing ion channel, other
LEDFTISKFLIKILSSNNNKNSLYNSDTEGSEFFERFQEILDQVDSDSKTGIFDSEKILRQLTPKCEELILKCKWGGIEYKCSEIIRLRRTYTGYCCTFNYVRPSGDEKGQPATYPAGIGGEMGLTVLLNLSSSDYYYPMRNYVGATVMVFDSNDFPESSTGELQEVPLEGFQEIRVTIAVNTKVADDQVQRYSIPKRQCMFKTDLKEEYFGEYSYGSCLLKCKIRSVLALCNCKLFNLPTNFPDVPLDEVPYCSLGNIGCLSKYKIKWATFRPREFIKVLSREIEDSLSCESCYPMCSSSKFTIDSTSAQLNFFYENRGSVM